MPLQNEPQQVKPWICHIEKSAWRGCLIYFVKYWSIEKSRCFLKGKEDPSFERNVARLHKILPPEIVEELYFLDKPKAFQLVCEKMKKNSGLAASILSSIDRLEK